MQQPTQARYALRPPRRRLFRRAVGARAFVGLFLLLAFGTTNWQSTSGSQCQRRLSAAVLQVDGVATLVIDVAHGHGPTADAGTPSPVFTCPVLAHLVRTPGAARGAGDASTPQSLLVRLVTSADPPALFRPPRLT